MNIIQKDLFRVGEANLYILHFIIVKNQIQGLIGIDKVMGDLIAIKTNTVYFPAITYPTITDNAKEINDLYFNLFFLLGGFVLTGENKDIFLKDLIEGLFVCDQTLDQEEKSSLITDQEFESLCEKHIKTLRIIPNLEQIIMLQNQLAEIMKKDQASNGTEREKARHLITVLKEGVKRIAIEEFGERTNIYQLIQTIELEGRILAAERFLGM